MQVLLRQGEQIEIADAESGEMIVTVVYDSESFQVHVTGPEDTLGRVGDVYHLPWEELARRLG